jgi:hypothetical protein
LVSLSGGAQAKGLAGSTEIGLVSGLLAHTRVSSSSSPTAGSDPRYFSPPSSSRTQGTSVGLLGSGYGVTVGHFLTDRLELGADVTLSTSSTKSEGFDGKSTRLSLVPRVDYVLGGDRVRPYVAAMVGWQHNWSSSESTQYLSHSNGSDSGIVYGGALGAHVFASDSWSFEPQLQLMRASASGSSHSTVSSESGTSTGGYDTRWSSTTILLSVGISGWFGGR